MSFRGATIQPKILHISDYSLFLSLTKAMNGFRCFLKQYGKRIRLYYIMDLRGIFTFLPENFFQCLLPTTWLS